MRECYACRLSPGLLAGLCRACADRLGRSPAMRAHTAYRRTVAERYDAAHALRLAVNKSGGSTCVRCDLHFPADKIEIDHVIPLSRGGADTVRNVVPLCASCHRAKTRREQGLVQ